MGISKQPRITIHVNVVYMARDVMILMRANPFRGPLGWGGPKVETFLGPEMTTSEASAIWALKCRQILVNDV